MFTTVQYFIKTSLIFLVVGILTGVYNPFTKNILDEGYNPELVSAHAHIILVGSVMMIIMGVALFSFFQVEAIILFSYSTWGRIRPWEA